MKRLESALGYIAFALFTSTGVLALFVIVTLIVRGPEELPEFVSTASARTTGTESAAETEGGPDLGTAAAAAAATDAAPTEAAAAPAATLDLAAGEKVFKKCASCHTIDKGGANRVGPNLWGVVNRSTAHAEGFKYSDAMLSHDAETWTPEHLDEYLAKPRDVIAGTTMSFAGLPKPEDRHNLIAWMAAQSDSPVAAEALPFAVAAATTTETATDATAEAPADTPADAPADTAEAPATDTAEANSSEPAQIPHTDPPGSDADDFSVIAARIAALTADSRAMDYERARFHPIHFPPQIETATNGECLTCHQEVLDHQVRAESPAGLKADEALAWYQTLDTYVPEAGTGQSDFHWRHLDSPLAQKVMNLQCNFCHRGNDPREESPDMMPLRAAFSADPATPEFTLRKMVNPSETCLLCHGAMPDPENIMGLGGPWPEIRADMEDQSSDDPTLANGCLSCHQELFRTNRHNVTYLKAAGIEDLAQAGSDTCYGCHGGRAWYRISYPYPRHPWPGMDPEVPEWAAERPTASDPRFQRTDNAPAQ